MSVINNSYQFIFVHVPKTAGTSITNVLSRYTNYCDIELGGTTYGEAIQPAYMRRFGLSKHSPAADIYSVVGAVTWSKYFSFSIVRNPFTRCLSTYHFLRGWEGAPPDLAKRMQTFDSFDEYVLSDLWEQTAGPDNIFRPQSFWLRSSPHKRDLLVDYVGRLESLEASLGHIFQVVGLPGFKNPTQELPRMNASAPSAISTIRNDRVIAKIVEKYRIDFQLFEYSVDPLSSGSEDPAPIPSP